MDDNLIFIGSFDHYEIGKAYRGLYLRKRDEPEFDVVFYIVREATHDEWYQYRTRNKLGITDKHEDSRARFYAVTTD